ncbi:DUF742 domain-containing protein [Prauserella cavernicola]|uniref:DUF742 domain-containing protein n=1 Tax=Prauserella cavernicola TaxID=2800127 RepID=A0A934QU14_9PSEU|nr:DUF742 domain-containing protein [Prauserella cavernicola]MBK1785363.1 DUF742 domain-containing protein [Prauserella cavernicola]
MDSGHARGDRRLDRGKPSGRWADDSDSDVPYRDQDEWHDRDWRSSRFDGPVTGRSDDSGEWLSPLDTGSQGPADFSVTDYRQRLMSGPGSELYGMGGGGLGQPDESAAFSAFAERSLDGGPSSQDLVPSPVPRQASLEPEQPAETTSGLVRPYFRTRGRTKPDYDLAIEALVSTSDRGRKLDRVRVPEHRSICGLCLDTRSVAEVAAHLRLPLGVVRVLVGDVAGLGLVLVHSATAMVGDRPSIEFMERVLSGLRRI